LTAAHRATALLGPTVPRRIWTDAQIGVASSTPAVLAQELAAKPTAIAGAIAMERNRLRVRWRDRQTTIRADEWEGLAWNDRD
jgi:hypothetical protein